MKITLSTFSTLFTRIIYLFCFLYIPVFGLCKNPPSADPKNSKLIDISKPAQAKAPEAKLTEPAKTPAVTNNQTAVANKPQTPQETCTPCHTATGNSEVSMWPKIAGQYRDYLLKQLREYQKGESGNRYNPSMYGMVEKLTDQELTDLADYYAKQTMSSGQAKAELVLLGEKIYRAGNPATGTPACSGCHGPTGAGNPLANIPKLNNQHMDYTVSQLKLYQTGERRSDPNQIMRNIASSMSEQHIQAVSSYLEGLYAEKT